MVPTFKKYSSMPGHIAHLIDSDPVMASQIKEHIPRARLLECLEIYPDVKVEIVKADPEQRVLLMSKARVFACYGFREIVWFYIVRKTENAWFKIFR